MPAPLDTSQLGPVRVEPGATPAHLALQRWWRENWLSLDPNDAHAMAGAAFKAGFEAGKRFVETSDDATLARLVRHVDQRGGGIR